MKNICVGAALTCFLKTASFRRRKELCGLLAECITQPALYLMHEDSSTIKLTGGGNRDEPLIAVVRVSLADNNALQVKEDGLFVSSQSSGAGGLTKVATDDSLSIKFLGEGTAENPLEADVQISATPNNALQVKLDGLHVETPAVGITEIAVDNSNTTRIHGAGTESEPLQVSVLVSSLATNGVTVRSDYPSGSPQNGLYILKGIVFAPNLAGQSFPPTVSNKGSTAGGNDASATGERSVALGMNATSVGERSVAIGAQAEALNVSSTALGANASATGINAIAIGSGAKASHESSTAIGCADSDGHYATTSRESQVSIANLDPDTHLSEAPRVLSGIATPFVDQDAANKAYANRVIAAVSNLDPATATVADVINAITALN